MKRFLLLALFFVANCFATHVAVLETIQMDGDLDNRECQFLTDKLRQMAVMTLPSAEGWTIMTRENINEMLPPGKTLEECEGSCLVETGKNISADYVVQGRVSHFGSLLTITVELYETATGKLVSSIAVKSENAEGLLEEIEKNAGPMFLAINNAPKKEVEVAQENSPEKESAAEKEFVAEKTEDAGNEAVAEIVESTKPADRMVLHSFNYVMPIEFETWYDGWGNVLGFEVNWSRYMIKTNGFSMVLSLTFGYQFVETYDWDYDGWNFDLKYGWGFAPFRDKFLLAFYGLAGVSAKYLFHQDKRNSEPDVGPYDRNDYSVLLGAKILLGYQFNDKWGLLAGVNVTADMWSQGIYENYSHIECVFAGMNIEPYIGIAVVF